MDPPSNPCQLRDRNSPVVSAPSIHTGSDNQHSPLYTQLESTGIDLMMVQNFG